MRLNFCRTLVCLLLVVPSFVKAGQGFIINSNGEPLVWQNTAADPIDIHPESGACGQFSNAQMLTRLTTNLAQWTGTATVDLGFNIVSGSIAGVDGCNYDDYLAGVVGNSTAQSTANVQDSLNPILFDNDGELIDSATGVSNGRFTILGFANPAGFSVDANDSSLFTGIVDGQAVFNCYCLEDANGDPANSDCPSTFSTDDLDMAQTHELGHFVNLDHTQINSTLAADSSATNDVSLPTMYPVAVSPANQKSPIEDDLVALSALYPSATFFTAGNSSSAYCKVTGTLLDRFGDEMRCADIQGIDSSDDANNVSFVSGSYAVATDSNGDNDTADDGECTSGCGEFTLYLRPGEAYTLKSASISSSFVGGSGISPCANSQITACTSTLISNCTDSSTSTTCRACVSDETLVTNDNAENISAKITAECTAGATVALGNITGSSISTDSDNTQTLVTAAGFSSSALSSEDIDYDDGVGPMYQTTCPESGGGTTTTSGSGRSAGCALQPLVQAGSLHAILIGFLALVFSFIGLRLKKSSFKK